MLYRFFTQRKEYSEALHNKKKDGYKALFQTEGQITIMRDSVPYIATEETIISNGRDVQALVLMPEW